MNIYKEKNWVVVKNFIDKNFANFLYDYVKNEAIRLDTLQQIHGVDNIGVAQKSDEFGTFYDGQIKNAFSKYGDLVFDTLLQNSTRKAEMATGLSLVPQYSYHRLYITDNELEKHIDRASCAISATIFLGSNSDVNWPLYLEDTNKNIQEINLKEGDALFYDGEKLAHWRDKFKGLNHAQVFLHYSDKTNNSENIINDGRPCLGILGKYKDNKYRLIY